MIEVLKPSLRRIDSCPGPIRPEILAAKLAAIHNLEHPELLDQITQEPRLVELLWFIQFISRQPGGLPRIVQEMLSRFPEQIGTREMLRIGKPRHGSYSLEQARKIWSQFPSLTQAEMRVKKPVSSRDFLDNWEYFNEEDVRLAKRKAHQKDADNLEEQLSDIDPAAFERACQDVAPAEITSYLAALCNEISKGFDGVWCFQNLFAALFQMMDLHAQNESKSLADTVVKIKIFDALDYAYSEKVLVRIEGNSRFGKSEATRTYCSMYPGRARLVAVPCSNCDADLWKACADALGIDYSLKTSRQEVKEKVEYVLRWSGLMIAFDESQFLIPVRFTECTPPMRLNWIRTQIVDKRVPCVLVSTYQNYQQAVNKFTRKTKYTIEQFLGRIALSVRLPEELSPADLMAVAGIHFPELDQDYLELIVGTAMQSESCLQGMENLSRRAGFLAKRSGRTQISVEDVNQAISEVLPSTIAAPARAAKSKPLRASRNAPAEPLQPVFNGSENSQSPRVATSAAVQQPRGRVPACRDPETLSPAPEEDLDPIHMGRAHLAETANQLIGG